ncbi:PaaI family thioesterase [Pseudooceanicola sp. LIPI14-2-Ac024]|uniref:PaaI family thioesterase n=1 Tax=Pseudooceanicola sp. LIPI14-2-Ac024 TaxID=3344875 RepID=UPI0035D0F39A
MDDATPDASADTGMHRLGGFNRMMGLRFTERGEGYLRAEIDLGPQHMNKAGVTHGGVYAAVLDSASTGAGLYCPYPGRVRQSSTLSLTVNYVGMSRGGTLHVDARVTKSGRTIYSVSAEVRDDAGTLCAHSIGTFKYMRGSEDPRGVPAAEG